VTGELASIWWGLILLGLGAGVVSGALGLGSGTVLVPIMVLLFCFPQKSAQGTALAVMVPVVLLGAFRYWRNPAIDVNLAVVGLLAAGGLAGVLIGTELAWRLPGHVLRKVFAIFILVLAVKLLVVPWKAKPSSAGGAGAGGDATHVEKGDAADDVPTGTGR